MKKNIIIIVLILLLIASWFYFTVTVDNVRTSQKAKMIDSISGIESNLEKVFILKQISENAFDSIRDENIRLQTKKKVNTAAWSNESAVAKQKCDTVIINQLDSIHLQTIVIYDSLLQNKELQIGFLRSELQLDTIALDMKDSIINVWSDAFLDLEELSKKQKRKSFRNGFITGFASGFISRSLLFRKQ